MRTEKSVFNICKTLGEQGKTESPEEKYYNEASVRLQDANLHRR
jgi:hypothetical protein